VGVAESSLQAQAAARAMITKYFAGIDFAWLPSPNDDMNANKFQVSLVTDEFRISLQRLLDQHVRPYLSSSLPSMPNTVLTGELLRIMLDRFAAGADNMTITSLFMMVHELNVQKFMESFQLQLNRLTESFELPVLLALIHAAITDLLDNSSNNLLHELSDLPAKLREEALERMKQDSQKCIERLEAQNQKVLTEKCMRIVNDVVTDALKMQFESSEPILPGDLESMVISELDDTLPSIATGSLRASCFEEARKTLAKHYNRPSQSDIVSAILQAASLTVNGQRHRGHELLTKWHKWMLRAPSAEELVALAGRLLIVPLAYAKNLAGELLSLAWIKEGMSLENCSFRNHFGLLILLAQYYGEQAPPHQDTEKIFLAGIELVKVQAPKQISDARCALAQFHKSQGRIDQALELYIEALQGDGTVGSVTLLGYLRCLAQAEGVKAAHDVALELLPSNKSTDDFGYVVYTTYLQRIISADEASAILLPAMENVFKLQDLPIHYWLIWWMELTKSFKPGKEMENPKAQSLSDILELWIGRAQNSFASMLIDGGSSHVAESLGLYWWKFSRESNPDLAHKYLLMALETSEGISSTYLLYRSFLLEYPDFLHAAGAAADPSMGSFLSLLGSSSREATATRFGDTNLRSLEASHEDDDSFRHHHLSSSSSSLSDSSSGEEYEKKFLGSALLLDLLSRALSSARSPKANSADPSKDFVDLDEMPEPGPSS
jgi:tetratricopeptide (TPR) repeat protein